MLERKWWTLIAVCTAIFMLLLDITIVNVALPDMQDDLDASFSQLQWVIDAYALTLATCMLAARSLADLLGRKGVFVTGLAFFTATSLLCGLSTSAGLLIAARAAQGVGGAIMLATSLALLSQGFHGRDRGTAFGSWGATVGAAVAIGPLAGGILTTGLNWRWIFFINVPIGLAAIALSVAQLHESKDPTRARLDWLGLVTLTGSLFLLVYALLEGNERGWSSGYLALVIRRRGDLGQADRAAARTAPADGRALARRRVAPAHARGDDGLRVDGAAGRVHRRGIGIGATNPPLASTAVAVVPPERTGMASGTSNTFRQVGLATGIAALGALFQHEITSSLADTLNAEPPHGLVRAVASGVTHENVRGAADAAFVSALNTVVLVAAIVAFAGAALVALLIRSGDLSHGRPSPAT